MNIVELFFIFCIFCITSIPTMHTFKTFKSDISQLNSLTKSKFTKYQSKMLDSLMSLKNDIPRHEKVNSLLWVPKDNPAYEESSKSHKLNLPFWFVSISEIALLDGLPIHADPNMGYSFASYKNPTMELTSSDIDKALVRTQELGFSTLFMINEDASITKFTL